tara:strand:+ start:317 stop:481 length:165 start_codon:yes stop_codon:yes gene_type:complete
LADRIVGVKGGWTTLESRCLVPFNASKNRRFEKGMHLDLHKKKEFRNIMLVLFR